MRPLNTVQFLSGYLRAPVFRSRCASAGPGLVVAKLPHVIGGAKLHLGEDVRILGKLGVVAGSVFDAPVLKIGNGVTIGDGVSFSVNLRIEIGDGSVIEDDCYFADNDGHPLDAEARVKGAPPAPEDIKPVVIGRNVTLGHRSYVMKGVTIGDYSRVLSGSVVMHDCPPHSVLSGNPARAL